VLSRNLRARRNPHGPPLARSPLAELVITATRALQQELPDSRVLIVTMHAEEEILFPVLAAGARAFRSKAAVDRDLEDALRVIAAGDVYIRPTVANELANSRIERAPQQTEPDHAWRD